ncbi:MAG: cellulase family glycosylhydrolase [Chloroflexi bacterium]|nr:cellulase family glycosylhydrolase [Chloroflexota bacterium]
MKRKHLITALVVLLALGALLALDLRGQGAVWHFFWSLTGEEAPLAHIRGMIELPGNLLRPQPNTAPMTSIQHAGLNPYGINTFLNLEAEPAKREEQLRMIAAAGFTWIRQQFPWEDLEIDGRGQYSDSRNDINGDGQVDTIDAWAKYDQIVALAEQYGLAIQVRLDNPPAWTHANPDIGSFAPPDDIQDFVNYAVALATRYRGRLFYYQVWNEPNIYPEWGEQAVNPEAYTELLCRTYDALKAVDPRIVVISAAMAPTISLTGRDLNDFIFLQRMYDAGAARCFDVMSVNGYGLNSGPTDQRMRPTTVTFARNIYIRDLMVANGDAHKPIWISEAAWNPVPDDPTIVNPLAFGQVTPEQAARYMPLGYERAQREWPWVGVIFYWFFTRPDASWHAQPQYYFRMVEPDYSPEHPTFTPLPIYSAMQDYIQNQTPILYPGVYQAEDWRVSVSGAAQVSAVEGAQFGQARSVSGAVRFRAYGTTVSIRLAGDYGVLIDGVVGVSGAGNEQTWREITLFRSVFPQTHEFRVSCPNACPLRLDTITVLDRTFENGYPIAVSGLALGLFALWVLLRAGRERRR